MNKKIAYLNREELKKVYKANSKLREYIRKDYEENQMYIVSQTLDYFRSSLANYSIDIYNNNYINVHDRNKFLEGIIKANSDHALSFDDSTILYETINIHNKLQHTDYDEENYKILEAKFNLMIEELKESVLKEFNNITMIESESYLFEAFTMIYVDDEINDYDFYIDEDYVLYKRVSYL
ncbi:hypothetical protein [Clostridioides difficile]|uniref:hypothetical protein n=1 Tax=Clostridioides difficile TaxID=1496 RepID=UPI001C14AE65|nr:hypothetical protein [Clostridioides difficile]MCP8386732.1 hypothetical protein [Clostridioides difficile]HBF7929182.1 hypothetical protein [Clostridioides difficile]HCQ5967495.1 hypothetical protein [Clostridioides difficile]